MVAKFTPGPWDRNIKPARKYPVIFAGRNTHVCVLSGSGMPASELEANADLIKAAPDMYALLRWIADDDFDCVAADKVRALLARIDGGA